MATHLLFADVPPSTTTTLGGRTVLACGSLALAARLVAGARRGDALDPNERTRLSWLASGVLFNNPVISLVAVFEGALVAGFTVATLLPAAFVGWCWLAVCLGRGGRVAAPAWMLAFAGGASGLLAVFLT